MSLSVLCCAAVARAGHAVIQRTRAQAVADAVALAWVTNGPYVAHEIARVSHSTVVDAVDNGATVRVVIHTGGAEASSTAERALPAVTDVVVDAGTGN